MLETGIQLDKKASSKNEIKYGFNLKQLAPSTNFEKLIIITKEKTLLNLFFGFKER